MADDTMTAVHDGPSAPLPPACDTSLWLTTDAGCVHHCCGPRSLVGVLAARFEAARIATAELGECCKDIGGPCAFDQFGEVEDIDASVLLTAALARAEGRDIGRPYRCARHGALTYGGCCG